MSSKKAKTHIEVRVRSKSGKLKSRSIMPWPSGTYYGVKTSADDTVEIIARDAPTIEEWVEGMRPEDWRG